ncbi:hypothetical protein GQ42DRAFT_154704 [Ramicandelaber brevisporus]|nr:hypothetical protein GQ42DRAFT_154704 [Ramicandelaber brevisporus]
MQTDPLLTQFPGREVQISQLGGLLSCSPTVRAVYIHGPTATGKSSVVRAVLNSISHSPSQVAWINAVECAGAARIIYERALSTWLSEHSTAASSSSSSASPLLSKCDSLAGFVAAVQSLPRNVHRYLVVDCAERLRDMHAASTASGSAASAGGGLLSILLRLGELCDNQNVTVVLISALPWDKVRPRGGCFEPMIIRFPAYSKQETLKILALDWRPPVKSSTSDNNDNDAMDIDDENRVEYHETQQFYSEFAKVAYEVFHRTCADLSEMRYLVALLFPRYITPILDDGNDGDESETIKGDGLVGSSFAEIIAREEAEAEQLRRLTLRNNTAAEVELPYYAKFMLISAYLASYNTARYDVRFFAHASDASGKTGRRARNTNLKSSGRGSRQTKHDDALAAANRNRPHLAGPKAFPMERMLAIFYSITGDEATVAVGSVAADRLVATLCSLKLLGKVTKGDKLDAVRLKCAATLDLVRSVAKSVQFDFDKYLEDDRA